MKSLPHLGGLAQGKLELCQVWILVHNLHTFLWVGIQERRLLPKDLFQLLDLHDDDMRPRHRSQKFDHESAVEGQVGHVKAIIPDAGQRWHTC